MGFLRDSLSIFKKNKLVFKERRQHSGNVYTFEFEKPEDLNWLPGQHGLFTVTHKKVKPPTKPFTIASSPKDDVIGLTTKIDGNPSEYKQALLELEPGMEMHMSGPVGSFYIGDESSGVFIAGGIGITPFRAILRENDSTALNPKQSMTLLYVDGEGTFTYKDELEDIGGQEGIAVHFMESSENLYKELELLPRTGAEKYFIAGPYSMVESVAKHLISTGIPKKNIKKETFIGY
ncbi:FAD-dependent oxidoreductase [Salinicoccus halodurans]|uniref:FAD-binding domain-containing protein n=1 Tax=Salinicoccus halodurans TaxID=407035 RepID=A0A0F7HJ70_9STAP|nr:FAD-dependent oxidoreductase [Salinicoccus halodurans]AKG73104.1 hypothetical protein AAT16_02060 [Salinicoccus halodurans]SFK85431.1 FAD-binding domain-containing protein [Salinicoccus halodurans]